MGKKIFKGLRKMKNVFDIFEYKKKKKTDNLYTHNYNIKNKV